MNYFRGAYRIYYLKSMKKNRKMSTPGGGRGGTYSKFLETLATSIIFKWGIIF